jgi:hypothetical protein
MTVIRVIFQIVLGVLFGLGAALALVPLFAAISPDGGSNALIFVVIGVVTLLMAFAPTFRRALGRGFLSVGFCVFALPLSALVLSGAAGNEVIGAAADTDKAAAAVGSAIAGGAITGLAGLVGFVLGSVLLLVGLVLSLGGRREVVVVEKTESGR